MTETTSAVPPARRARRPRGRALALVAAAAVVLAACGSSDGSDGVSANGDATTTVASGDTTTTTEAAAAPLEILVSNDDGYEAEGIDVLVEALRKVDDVEVTVVAPLSQQSGQGGKTTEGELKVTDVTLASGYPAKAVDGYPADTIRVAVDELGIEPDVVITGINSGQNLGPLVDLSGTVGAARAAVARGIPALATSQGVGDTFDYPSAVPFILDWLDTHRADLAAGKATATVWNLNVPSCKAGTKVRGLAEVPADLDGDTGQALAAQDCASTTPLDDLDGDVAAFVAGYATFDEVPAKPAS